MSLTTALSSSVSAATRPVATPSGGGRSLRRPVPPAAASTRPPAASAAGVAVAVAAHDGASAAPAAVRPRLTAAHMTELAERYAEDTIEYVAHLRGADDAAPFECGLCRHRLQPWSLAAHVASVGHASAVAGRVAASAADADCDVTINGIPLRLPANVVDLTRLLGAGRSLFHDGARAVLTPDAFGLVRLACGAAYTVVEIEPAAPHAAVPLRHPALPRATAADRKRARA